MSYVQAVLFDKNKFTTEKCRRWLKSNNFEPLKRVDVTDNYYRYRIIEPDDNHKYRVKKIDDKIKFIIGFPS